MSIFGVIIGGAVGSIADRAANGVVMDLLALHIGD